MVNDFGATRIDNDGGESRPTGPPVAISVVIPIYNRPRQLACLLDALGRQDFQRDRFEVIVCDDGSTEDLAEIVAAAWVHRLHLTHLRQENLGPGPARNLGLARAVGDVVAFTDSDCLPDPGWLAAYDRAFANPAVALAGGRIESRGAEHISGRCINFLNESTLGAAGATNPQALVHMEYYPRTSNMAVRRAQANAVGGFSGYSHGEDLDFSHRVRDRAGTPPIFVADAVILHNECRTPAQLARENFLKGAARIRLRRQLGQHEPIHAMPAMLVLYLIALPVLAVIRLIPPAWLAIPAVIYGVALAILSVQGAIHIGDLRALVTIPFYTALVHVSYGLGYLIAALGLTREANGRANPTSEVIGEGQLAGMGIPPMMAESCESTIARAIQAGGPQ